MRPLHSLCLLIALAAPSLARAGLPSVGNDTVPLCISLVGSLGVVPAAAGQFVVVARDLANNPMPGVMIVVDVSAAPDLFLCADQLDPAATVDCVHKTVGKLTAADGSVQFTILGGSNGAGNASTLFGGGHIYKNGTLIGSPTVSAYDLDSSGGLGANDLSAWLSDFYTGNPYGRSDYDCSGNLGANDLSLWIGAFGSGTMVQSCASGCP